MRGVFGRRARRVPSDGATRTGAAVEFQRCSASLTHKGLQTLPRQQNNTQTVAAARCCPPPPVFLFFSLHLLNAANHFRGSRPFTRIQPIVTLLIQIALKQPPSPQETQTKYLSSTFFLGGTQRPPGRPTPCKLEPIPIFRGPASI